MPAQPPGEQQAHQDSLAGSDERGSPPGHAALDLLDRVQVLAHDRHMLDGEAWSESHVERFVRGEESPKACDAGSPIPAAE
jgi:hypothetical protein